MRTPFEELRVLALALWNDAIFHRLLALIIAVALGLLIIVGIEWETVMGFVALGCLAAMLEAIWRK